MDSVVPKADSWRWNFVVIADTTWREGAARVLPTSTAKEEAKLT